MPKPIPSKVKPTGDGHAKAWIMPKSSAVAPIAALSLFFLLIIIITIETKRLKSKGAKALVICICNCESFSNDLSPQASEKALNQSSLN